MTRKSLGINVGRSVSRTVAIGSGVVLLAGCSFGGLNSLNMPGTAGHGRGCPIQSPRSCRMSATLPQNSPVMVDDVTVGSVSGVEAVQRADGTFYAAVKLLIGPRGQVAGQCDRRRSGRHHYWGRSMSSCRLRWVSHLLVNCVTGQRSRSSHGGRFLTTEEVLSALGVVVNKGNLGAIQDITQEVSAAVSGRQGQFADLIPRLAELSASLNRQTEEIISAAEGPEPVRRSTRAQQGQSGPCPEYAS